MVLGSNVAVGAADHATAAAECDLERGKASAALQAALGQLQVPAVDCGALLADECRVYRCMTAAMHAGAGEATDAVKHAAAEAECSAVHALHQAQAALQLQVSP